MTEHSHRRTENFYGALAFGSVVLSCYSGFLPSKPFYYSSASMVPVVFGLGAAYIALGVLGGAFVEGRGNAARACYYLLHCALLTAIIWLSPIRGFFSILVLPVVSQAILDLRARYATLIGGYLLTIAVSIWTFPYGWGRSAEAIFAYFTAFAFTVVFSLVTKQALQSREREAKLRQEVEDANRLLRDHAAQTEDLATTRERNRLAREIHDGLGHYLTVVKTQLDAANALLPDHPERARESIGKAARLAGEALDDVRRSVSSLRTEATRPPLPEALQLLTLDAGLPVTVRIEGTARPLTPGIEHALFRSAQEGLTNIRKHAAASVGEISLGFGPTGKVTLKITDNGRGTAGSASTKGFGLTGLCERIELLGGKVMSGNRPEGGFALTVEVPA